MRHLRSMPHGELDAAGKREDSANGNARQRGQELPTPGDWRVGSNWHRWVQVSNPTGNGATLAICQQDYNIDGPAGRRGADEAKGTPVQGMGCVSDRNVTRELV